MGGFFLGKKKWEEAPKEYVASASVSFNVRDVFVSSQQGVRNDAAGVPDANEAEVLRQAQSEDFLQKVARKLELTKRWEMSATEVVARLRSALDLDLDTSTDQLQVNTNLNHPQDAADFANAVAEELPELIVQIDEQNKEQSVAQLVIDAQPFVDEEVDAKSRLREALLAKGVKIEPGSGVDLGDYLLIPEVREAKLDWDSAKESLEAFNGSQSKYQSYWSKRVRPSMVIAKALAPPSFVGPALRPFETRWSVYGMTAGLIAGSLMMLACWKLFP